MKKTAVNQMNNGISPHKTPYQESRDMVSSKFALKPQHGKVNLIVIANIPPHISKNTVT